MDVLLVLYMIKLLWAIVLLLPTHLQKEGWQQQSYLQTQPSTESKYSLVA